MTRTYARLLSDGTIERGRGHLPPPISRSSDLVRTDEAALHIEATQAEKREAAATTTRLGQTAVEVRLSA